MTDVSDTLEERGETHGDFRDVSRVSQYIKGAISAGTVSAYQRESLDMIATKMARIVCGDPHNVDHWLDIEGYARLARNILEGNK